MTLEQTISAIRPLDEKSMTAARNRFANIAMPLGGLGLLQDAIVQLAGILGQSVPDISRRAAVVFCADNGVVAEGVTQCGQEVTATVAENMGRGESTVCLMAKQLGMDVFPVDIGVAQPIKSEKVLQFSVRRGTANFTHEPAMTRKEAIEAVEIGIKMAEMCAEKGYSNGHRKHDYECGSYGGAHRREGCGGHRTRSGSVNGRSGAKNRGNRGGAGASQTRPK